MKTGKRLPNWRRIFACGTFVAGEIRYQYVVGDTKYVVRKLERTS